MAIFHAQSIPLSRRTGRSAVAAAAYRSASELRDEREGRDHDYARKRGVLHTEIVLPDGSALGESERGALWNSAERAEKRKDARTAREWVIALPHELSSDQRGELVRAFAVELAERYGVAVDVAIHAPHRNGDARNWHAHLLATTRTVELADDGRVVLGEKATIELADRERRKRGLGSGAEEIEAVRARWAEFANRALERAGYDERIDHRSLEAQGLDRAGTVHLGPVASEMERRGVQTDRGDTNRGVRADNAVRAELGAKVFDLQAERARRLLEREQAEKDAAAARAAELAAEQQRAAEADRARQDERLERMSAGELEQEIARHLPPIRAFVEKLPVVVAARERAEGLAEELKQAQRARRQAEREVEVFRAEHPVRAKLHDLGITDERYLRTRAEVEATAPERVKKLKQRVREAEDEYAEVKKRERKRIEEAMKPQREHVARLHELLRDKRAQEREQQREREAVRRTVEHVEDLARRRSLKMLGDQDPRWQELPERLRVFVDGLAQRPKEERVGLVQQELRAAPELRREVGRALERGRGRGR